MIYSELKAPDYEKLRKKYISEGLDYPEVVISNCPVLHKNLSFMSKNNAIEYSAVTNQMKVCKNYVMSKQHLREELRRESTLAFAYRNKEGGAKLDLQKQLNKFACATISACANEMFATQDAHSND